MLRIADGATTVLYTSLRCCPNPGTAMSRRGFPAARTEISRTALADIRRSLVFACLIVCLSHLERSPATLWLAKHGVQLRLQLEELFPHPLVRLTLACVRVKNGS